MDILADLRAILNQAAEDQADEKAQVVFGPPADRESIGRLEQELGLRFPTDFVAMYTQANGAGLADREEVEPGTSESSVPELNSKVQWLLAPLEDIASMSSRLQQRLDEMQSDGANSDRHRMVEDAPAQPNGEELSDSHQPDIIVIGDWGDGDPFAYVRTERGDQTSGTIYEWDHETQEFEHTRATLLDYLGLYAQSREEE